MWEVRLFNWVFLLDDMGGVGVECFYCGSIVSLNEELKSKITLKDLESSFPFCSRECYNKYLKYYNPVKAYILEK